jgi:hypothetical protein
VFSVEPAPRLYNEDLKQVGLELRESPELAVGSIIEKKLQERLCKEDFIMCCSNSETVIEYVARSRLVKTEDTSVNSELYSVEIAIAL